MVYNVLITEHYINPWSRIAVIEVENAVLCVIFVLKVLTIDPSPGTDSFQHTQHNCVTSNIKPNLKRIEYKWTGAWKDSIGNSTLGRGSTVKKGAQQGQLPSKKRDPKYKLNQRVY